MVAEESQRIALAPKPDGKVTWPNDGTLDVDALRQSGWAPTPFRQWLVKVTPRCNLDCDYCYVYHLADQSWRVKPRRMSPAVLRRTGERIAEHVLAHDLSSISLVLHGGEPMLPGLDYLRDAVDILRAAIPSEVKVRFGMQTNATLVTEEIAQFLVQERFGVGVSLDGSREANDLHRMDRRGRSSYDAARRGLDLLLRPEYRACVSGLLSTIDLANDPMATYEELLTIGAPSVEFLLPHGTWAEPPPGWVASGATPYADWLIPIFDAWFRSPSKPVRIRFFEEVIHLVLGGRTALELLGLEPVRLVVVESDGSIEQVDSLKAAFEGAPETGLDIFTSSFDEVLKLPSIAARQIGIHGLALACQACDLHAICGGGLYTHRYSTANGFLNPSVYCADLYRLIGHIRATVQVEVDRRAEALH